MALALLRAVSSEEAAFWILGGVCCVVNPLYYVPSMTGTQVGRPAFRPPPCG